MGGWDAEVAVVGLGAWGASALWQLAERGVDVIGFERFTPGHSLGSSHGGSRMFRITCLEHPELVPLARRSRELWDELEQAAGEQLFFPTGGLLIGPENGHIAGGTLLASRRHDIPVHILSANAVRIRYPRHTGVPTGHIGVWEPSAGIIRPERSILAAVALAERAGARVHADTRISSVELVPGGAVLHTSQRDVRVRQVVVTVGSWLSSLVPGLPLETVRMPITWFRPLEPATDSTFELDQFPVFMRELDDGTVLWGNGTEGGHDVKLGLEDRGVAAKPLDPDNSDRSVTPDDWSDLAALLPAKVPGLEPLPARVAVCMLTRTPDGQFVIGRPDGDPRIVVAGGCNAHGFKHATGIGEALAGIVCGTAAKVPLDFMSPDRF
ncbi:putative sarcosine oxidase [Actinacidiphila reveromycinica]|uniref:Putative sarcosine oxidase n=1 Tax=Actinacidiphila reveromycinica TaxID=659352 RepID=A0A7U3UWE8_9ACTN|nr:N-methyl-L-tryptophan oxidase [Streptomyces sp. SN-593]BBB00113.1 putative sarcosine oxidase [Streptomyces sp. SN-593]